MINEAASILDEGVVARASDIDVVWLTGYGFPRFRGGPLYYADQLGLRAGGGAHRGAARSLRRRLLDTGTGTQTPRDDGAGLLLDLKRNAPYAGVTRGGA